MERNKKKMKGEWGANTEGAERRPDEVSISDPGMLWSDRKNLQEESSSDETNCRRYFVMTSISAAYVGHRIG